MPIAVLAAAVAGLLFWLMRSGRDDQGAGSTPRALGFAVLGGIVVLLLAANRQPAPGERTEARGDMGRAFRSYTQALMDAKRSFVPLMIQSRPGMPVAKSRAETAKPRVEAEAVRAALKARAEAEKVRAEAIRAYQDAVREAPTSRLFRRQLAILAAFEGKLDLARAQFRELARLQRQRGEPGAEAEARLWIRLAAPTPPARSAVPALRDQIVALELGWFEHLALETLYRRAGETRLAQQEIRKAEAQAWSQMLLLSAIGLGMLLLGLIGFLGAPFFLWLIARGKLKPVPFRPRVAPAVLWEAFILYLFLHAAQVIPQLLLPSPRPQGTERGMAQFILMLVGSDVLQLLSVLYLWAMLRQRQVGLGEVGLHARALAANVGFGLMAYVVALPWVFAVAALTQWLGEHFFPNVAPPFHPIQALTAGAREWWLRLALFAIAAIGAPFFEELFFRGTLHGALRRRFGIAVGVVVSAAFFSLLHPQLPLGFLPIFFLGAVFAVIYEWRQSLVPGMVFHAVNNGFIFLLMNVLYAPGG